MSASAVELQEAIFSALTSDERLVAMLGAVRIYDTAPSDTPFPYLTFGRTSAFDWSTASEDGCEQLVTIHIWSKTLGKAQSLELGDIVRDCLHERELALKTHRLVSLRAEFAETRHEEELDIHHGLVRFRALTERMED